jgi:hypothetical protein
MFIVITGKVIMEVELRGGKVLYELVGSNRGKVRLISRAEGKKNGKGKIMGQDSGQNERPL